MAYLLRLGADINADDHAIKGFHGVGTPLNAAVDIFAVDRIRFLVSRSAQVNKEAVRVARQRSNDGGHPEIVSLLEKARQSQGGAAVPEADN